MSGPSDLVGAGGAGAQQNETAGSATSAAARPWGAEQGRNLCSRLGIFADYSVVHQLNRSHLVELARAHAPTKTNADDCQAEERDRRADPSVVLPPRGSSPPEAENPDPDAESSRSAAARVQGQSAEEVEAAEGLRELLRESRASFKAERETSTAARRKEDYRRRCARNREAVRRRSMQAIERDREEEVSHAHLPPSFHAEVEAIVFEKALGSCLSSRLRTTRSGRVQKATRPRTTGAQKPLDEPGTAYGKPLNWTEHNAEAQMALARIKDEFPSPADDITARWRAGNEPPRDERKPRAAERKVAVGPERMEKDPRPLPATPRTTTRSGRESKRTAKANATAAR